MRSSEWEIVRCHLQLSTFHLLPLFSLTASLCYDQPNAATEHEYN